MSNINNKISEQTYTVPAPTVTLNATDKIYLAVAQKSTAQAHFVFALICRQAPNSNSYFANAETESATFTNAAHANLYAETVCQIAAFQKKAMPKLYEMFTDWNRTAIETFAQNTR